MKAGFWRRGLLVAGGLALLASAGWGFEGAGGGGVTEDCKQKLLALDTEMRGRKQALEEEHKRNLQGLLEEHKQQREAILVECRAAGAAAAGAAWSDKLKTGWAEKLKATGASGTWTPGQGKPPWNRGKWAPGQAKPAWKGPK